MVAIFYLPSHNPYRLPSKKSNYCKILTSKKPKFFHIHDVGLAQMQAKAFNAHQERFPLTGINNVTKAVYFAIPSFDQSYLNTPLRFVVNRNCAH